MTEENNRDGAKKKEELMISTLLLHQLGYEPDDKMSSEGPDIIIPSKEHGNIGIEVTKYLNKTDSACLNNFNKVLEDYAVLFDKKKKEDIRYDPNISYRIRVFLQGGFAPSIKEWKHKKECIFEEIDRYLFPSQSLINNEYVEYANKYEAPNLPKTKVELSYIGVYGEIDEELLFSRIRDKEEKLKKYKTLEKNKELKEYFLLIFIPELHQVDIKGYQLPKDYKTEYDRIYLTKGADCLQIK